MEREFFGFKHSVLEEQNCEPAMECLESSLLDLEFESICPGEFDGFKSGPTLAELNETRSRSPLINPEMKRLHQVAIRTVGETSEKPCEGTLLLQPKSHSVLEQQLRTQPSSSICYEQYFPSRKDSSEQLSSTVNRSEPIRIPGRDVRAPQTEHNALPMSPPSQERKVFADSYKKQNASRQLISPRIGSNYSVSNEGYGLNSPSSSSTAAHSVGQQHRPVSGEQLSKNRSSKDEATTDQYDVSEDEEFESDDEMDDTEEYCPDEKEGKMPTRRKGRKSESEDMVPNPTKLLHIGRELDRLNKIISDLKPINELPQHSRGRSRKEKNKLASRYNFKWMFFLMFWLTLGPRTEPDVANWMVFLFPQNYKEPHISRKLFSDFIKT